MDFKITSSTEGAALIERDGKSFLAIATGLKSKTFAGVKTTHLQSLPGILVDNGKIENWKIEGLTEIESEIYFYGPYLKGSSLPNLTITEKIIAELSSFFETIKDRDFPIQKFSLSSAYRTDDGKMLFFPPLLMEFLNSRRPEKNSLEMISPWNHPDLEGEQALAFTIAALTYKIVSGHPAFSGKTEVEIQRSMRNKNYASLLVAEPSLKKDIVRVLEDSFEGRGSLDSWRNIFALWNSEGRHDNSLSKEDSAGILLQAEKKEKKRQQKQKTQAFFNKNKTKLIIITAVVIMLGLIIKTPLAKALAPPITIGMSQIEVIELYYDCFRTLDFEIMEDCITSDQGKNDINQITTLYATTRVRTAYGESGAFLDVEKWKTDGKPLVQQGILVWGLTEFRIQQVSTDTFEIDYEKWFPAVIEDPEDTSLRMPDGIFVKDEVHLSIIKDAWKIDRLRRTNLGDIK